MIWCLSLRHSRADHDVAEQQGQVTWVGGCTIGPTAGRYTVQHRVGLERVDRKRQYIGWPTACHVVFIELCHLAFGYKQQRQFSEAANTFGTKDAESELLPPLELDGDIALLIGAEYLWLALAADSSWRREPRS